VQERNALVHRTKGLNQGDESDSDSSLSNSDGESDSDEAIRKKAAKKIKGVVESSEESGSDDEGSES